MVSRKKSFWRAKDEGIDFDGCNSVGVVAGASTPAGIIKEVIKTMSENLQPVEEQMEVKESVQKSFEEMTDEELAAAGVSPDLIRLSCGIEGAEDLIADIENALKSI